MKNLFSSLLRRPLGLLLTLLLAAGSAQAQTATTDAPSNVTLNSADMGGSVNKGTSLYTSIGRGVVYSATNTSPTIGGSGVIQDANGTSNGAFSKTVGGLTPGTTYYVRAYGTRQYVFGAISNYYGPVQSFATLTDVPVITTPFFNQTFTTTTPSFDGYVTVGGSTVRVYVDGGLVGTTTAAANGVWSVVSAVALGQGSHRVQATSQAGSQPVSATSNSTYFWVDSEGPTVTVASSVGSSGAFTSSTPIQFSVFFSESVAGFLESELVVTNGTVSVFSGGTATSFYFNVTPTANGPVTVTVPANVVTDGVGNGNTASATYTVNYAQPSTPAPAVSAPANNGYVTTATPAYSGTALAYSTVNVYVDGNSIGTTSAPYPGSWTKTQPSPLTEGPHTVRATAQSSGSSVSPSSNTNTFTVDTVLPTATIAAAGNTNGGSTSSSFLSCTVTFSEAVTGFAASDVTVGGATLSGFTAVSATVYTFNLTLLGNGTKTVDVPANAAVDVATNGNPAAPQFSITYTQPVTATPVVAYPAQSSRIATATPAYTGTAPAGSTVTVLVDGGSFTGTTVATAGGTWSLAQPTALAQGNHSLQATAQSSGEALSAYSSNRTFTVDTVAPTATITSTAGANGSTTAATPIPFRLTFSEVVTGLNIGSIVVTNGAKSALAGSGSVYTFSVTPTTSAAVTVNVAANQTTDVAGNGNIAVPQFSITYTAPTTLSTWTGATDTDWFAPGNWSGGVPTAMANVVVPAGAPRYPAIGSGTATVRDLTVSAGARLAQTGGTLDVRGTLANNGTFAPTGGAVVLGGSSNQTVGGSIPNRFRDLTVGAAGATLGGTTTVVGVLTLTGNLTTTGQTLTLESSATGTALVVNSGGSIVGTATVQRYLTTANAGLGYRHYSSPVSGNTLADLATASFAPEFNQAYNSSAAPGAVRPFPSVFGYDETRLGTSPAAALDAFSKGWAVPTAATAFAAGTGYAVRLPGTEVVDFVGTPRTGDHAVSLTRGPQADAGWALVGNPYPAPIDWSRVVAADRPGLDASFYVFESSSAYGGSYRTAVNGIGASNYIGLGQGFFVRVSAGQTAGTLTFRNAHRLTDYAQQVAVRRGAADARPLVQLALAGNGAADNLYVYAEAGATAGIDAQYDAAKLANPSGLNLSSAAATGATLAIDGRAAFAAGLTLPLAVAVPAAGSYTLAAPAVAHLPAGLAAYLVDHATGTRRLLLPGTAYAFTAAAAGQLAGRFVLAFGPAAAGPLATAAGRPETPLTLAPNPTCGAVTLALPAAAQARPVTVADALGRVVRKTTLPAQTATLTLDVAGLAPGVYTVRCAAATARLLVE